MQLRLLATLTKMFGNVEVILEVTYFEWVLDRAQHAVLVNGATHTRYNLRVRTPHQEDKQSN